MMMSFEKAELILQTLLTSDRDFHLVRNLSGKAQITDHRRFGDDIVERMPKKKRRSSTRQSMRTEDVR